MKDSTLPENVELLRTRVLVEKDRVYSVRTLNAFHFEFINIFFCSQVAVIILFNIPVSITHSTWNNSKR